MLEKKSSLTSQPMPSRDSRILLSLSLSCSSWAAWSSRRILFCLYSWGLWSWLLMSCTMGWFLLEVVLLGKYLSLLRPRDWFIACLVLGFILWKDLCQKWPSTSSAFLSEESWSVLWLQVRFFTFCSSQEDWQFLMRGFCLQDMLITSLFSSFPGDFTSLLERFSIRLGGTGSLKLLPESLLNPSSPCLRVPKKSRSGERGLKSCGVLALAWSKRGRSSSSLLVSARKLQSSLSQSLRQAMMLLIMASSPSGVVGRQILTWFSMTSGLIQAKISRSPLKNTMFSFIMKKPYLLASLTHAPTTTLAYPIALSSEFNSFNLTTGSLFKSSVHISWILFQSLPTMILGVPSMQFSSRLTSISLSLPLFNTTLWHTLSPPFIQLLSPTHIHLIPNREQTLKIKDKEQRSVGKVLGPYALPQSAKPLQFTHRLV